MANSVWLMIVLSSIELGVLAALIYEKDYSHALMASSWIIGNVGFIWSINAVH